MFFSRKISQYHEKVHKKPKLSENRDFPAVVQKTAGSKAGGYYLSVIFYLLPNLEAVNVNPLPSFNRTFNCFEDLGDLDPVGKAG